MQTKRRHARDGVLANTQQLFEHWRRTRRRRGPIPDGLWQMASQAAVVHGVHATARRLRLNATKLKMQMQAAGATERNRRMRAAGPSGIEQRRGTAGATERRRQMQAAGATELEPRIRVTGSAERKERIQAAGEARAAEGGLQFVELPWLAAGPVPECILEAEDLTGRKLRIHLKAGATAQAGWLGRMLWSGQP